MTDTTRFLRCGTCKCDKPETDFSVRTQGKCGRQSSCKQCMSEKLRAWKQARRLPIDPDDLGPFRWRDSLRYELKRGAKAAKMARMLATAEGVAA